MSEHKIPIPAMLYNAAVGGHVTNSQQIIDENENKEQSQINFEVKQTLGKGGSVDARINQAKTDIIGGASHNGNTLKKIEDRVSPLETAIGTGGNIDARIADAVNTEKTRAEEAEQLLQEQYNALTQSDIVVGSLPVNGTKNLIYRVPGINSYSDYMWDGTQFIKMAEYNNAIDDAPIAGSENLVNSGGVYNKFLNQSLNSVNRFNKDTKIDNKWQQVSGNIIDLSDYFISDFIPVVPGETIYCNYGQSQVCTITQYTQQRQLIPNTSHYFSLDGEIIVSNAAYIIVSMGTWGANDLMVCKDALPNIYVPYQVVGNNNTRYDIEARPFKLTETPLLEEMEIVPTTYVDGVFEHPNTNFQTSDFIEIKLDSIDNYYFYSDRAYPAGLLNYYDKNKNIIMSVIAESQNIASKVPMICTFPKGCQYVKYARAKGDITGLYKMPRYSFKEIINLASSNRQTNSNAIVWVGTSIPEGATYPQVSSKACGYNCINNALGEQSLAIRNGDRRCMMYTQEEFYNAFHSQIGDSITQAEYNKCIDKTFERNVLPFVKGDSLTVNDGNGSRIINPDAIKVSAIIIDHGYNDYVNILSLLEDENNIDWTSRDRNNFVGAINYLVDEIQKINPFIKIIIGGYFQNTGFNYGNSICKMQKLVSEHLMFDLFDVWNYSQISQPGYIKGTSGYLDWFNNEYGTDYHPNLGQTDENGNIIALRLYCPDGIHPHSDLTQNCNKRLNAIYAKLLKNII